VDPEVFRPRDGGERRSQFAAPQEKILLHISNFRPVKNLPAVIRVFEEVTRRVPARLLLVGDGPERIPTERQIQQRGLSARVTFLGNQEFVEEVLPVADAFLLPSLHESFGLVALEAMSVGVPVIATNTGGTREVLEDGVSGFLRDPHDVPGMAEAVISVLTDPVRHAAVVAAARERAHTLYRPERIVEAYLKVYRGGAPDTA
jgi:N-acetyl-alpha-D-glucosaminyl L-malate synthase BshA